MPAVLRCIRHALPVATALALLLAACGWVDGGDTARYSEPTLDGTMRMKTNTPTAAATSLLGAVEDAVGGLSIQREAMQTRINRCQGTQGEQRDDLFYAWVGLRGMAHQGDIAEQLRHLHQQWLDRGWTITRFRTLDNGGVNLAATDPGTGNTYMLDSGFDVAPDAAVAGFFNTPCFQSADGAVDFGQITVPSR